MGIPRCCKRFDSAADGAFCLSPSNLEAFGAFAAAFFVAGGSGDGLRGEGETVSSEPGIAVRGGVRLGRVFRDVLSLTKGRAAVV